MYIFRIYPKIEAHKHTHPHRIPNIHLYTVEQVQQRVRNRDKITFPASNVASRV